MQKQVSENFQFNHSIFLHLQKPVSPRRTLLTQLDENKQQTLCQHNLLPFQYLAKCLLLTMTICVLKTTMTFWWPLQLLFSCLFYSEASLSLLWIMPASPKALWELVQTMQYEPLIPQHSPLMLLFVYCCCFRIKPAVWPNLPDHKKTLEQLCKKPKNVCSFSVLSTWVWIFGDKTNAYERQYVHFLHELEHLSEITSTFHWREPTFSHADVSRGYENNTQLN